MFTIHDYEKLLALHDPTNRGSGMTVTMVSENGNEYLITFETAGVPIPPNGSLRIIEGTENKDGCRMELLNQEGIPQVYFSLKREKNKSDELPKIEVSPAISAENNPISLINNDVVENALRKENLQPVDLKEEKASVEIAEVSQEKTGNKKTLFFGKKPLRLGSIQDIRERFGSYPPLIGRMVFREGDFVLSSVMAGGSESGHPGNEDNLKKLHVTSVSDGILYDVEGNILSNSNSIYVVDRKGRLYISDSSGPTGAIHHSYFLKKEGYGKPIASGGHIVVENGKIKGISNSSGHYKPNQDQLVLVVKYLDSMGVLAQDVGIFDHSSIFVSLKEIRNLDTEAILKKYLTLDSLHEMRRSENKP